MHKKIINIKQAAKEITQNRSNYQLEKFVLGQHHSPEMQYHQLVIELNGLLKNKKETELRLKKIKAEAEELRATGKKSDAIEAEIKELSLEDMENTLFSQQREIDHLQALFDASHKYSREEIEAAQKDYWEQRLTRVAQLQMLSRQGGVDWAQLDAIQQANIIEKALVEIPTFNYITDETNKLQLGEKND